MGRLTIQGAVSSTKEKLALFKQSKLAPFTSMKNTSIEFSFTADDLGRFASLVAALRNEGVKFSIRRDAVAIEITLL